MGLTFVNAKRTIASRFLTCQSFQNHQNQILNSRFNVLIKYQVWLIIGFHDSITPASLVTLLNSLFCRTLFFQSNSIPVSFHSPLRWKSNFHSIGIWFHYKFIRFWCEIIVNYVRREKRWWYNTIFHHTCEETDWFCFSRPLKGR